MGENNLRNTSNTLTSHPESIQIDGFNNALSKSCDCCCNLRQARFGFRMAIPTLMYDAANLSLDIYPDKNSAYHPNHAVYFLYMASYTVMAQDMLAVLFPPPIARRSQAGVHE